jgi:threonine/homoserine/homoserine lactone efflux protein
LEKIYKFALEILAANPVGNADSLGIPKVRANNSTLQNTLNAAFGIIGLLSVIFLIWGAFQYVLSGGDPENAKKAKESVLYAVIGLAVALLAFTIVNFVAGAVFL